MKILGLSNLSDDLILIRYTNSFSTTKNTLNRTYSTKSEEVPLTLGEHHRNLGKLRLSVLKSLPFSELIRYLLESKISY